MIQRDGQTFVSMAAFFAGQPMPECSLPTGTQAAIAGAVSELRGLLDVCANGAPTLGDRADERFAAVVERVEAIEATLLGDHECKLAVRWDWHESERRRKDAMGRR